MDRRHDEYETFPTGLHGSMSDSSWQFRRLVLIVMLILSPVYIVRKSWPCLNYCYRVIDLEENRGEKNKAQNGRGASPIGDNPLECEHDSSFVIVLL